MVSSSFFSRFKALVIKQKRVVIICICVILFVELLDDVLEGDLMTLDRLARAFFVETYEATGLRPLWRAHQHLPRPFRFLYFFSLLSPSLPASVPVCFAL